MILCVCVGGGGGGGCMAPYGCTSEVEYCFACPIKLGPLRFRLQVELINLWLKYITNKIDPDFSRCWQCIADTFVKSLHSAFEIVLGK
jgi:hypothetical protein